METFNKPLLILPVSIVSYGGQPALQIRKTIRDPEKIHELSRYILQHGYLDLPARLIIVDPFRYYYRLQEIQKKKGI